MYQYHQSSRDMSQVFFQVTGSNVYGNCCIVPSQESSGERMSCAMYYPVTELKSWLDTVGGWFFRILHRCTGART